MKEAEITTFILNLSVMEINGNVCLLNSYLQVVRMSSVRCAKHIHKIVILGEMLIVGSLTLSGAESPVLRISRQT
jgi:hypothetical protein